MIVVTIPNIKLPDVREHNTIAPELLPYVMEFNKQFKTSSIGLTAGFVEDSGENMAVCYRYPTNLPLFTEPGSYYNEIVVSRLAWDYIPEYARELLIFHELGHCIMGLDHNEELTRINGIEIAKSLMYPTNKYDWAYPQNRTYYIEELRQAYKQKTRSTK